MKTQVHKSSLILKARPGKVITLPSIYPGLERVKNIYDRILALTPEATVSLLDEVREEFSARHKDLEASFLENFAYFRQQYPGHQSLSEERKLLLGASLTKEYSIQSAALFNPSMVSHPDQSGLQAGQKRFLISLRATGEGHISSIVFRSGVTDEKGNLTLDEESRYCVTGRVHTKENASDYSLEFPADSLLSERVIFPQTEAESMGMEDLRLVEFREKGRSIYYGTYTAYNGREIRSQLLITEDFRSFRIRALSGAAVKDKGMALFPEKVNGKYAIISRQGGENISIMFSEDLFHWEDHQLLMKPAFPFEISQIGNCGSPIRTAEGWLLLTHGVGPLRKYTISAVLLDPDDPTRVIRRLPRPLLEATGAEREGYVPNVVYSCGAMTHGGILYIPYAMSDSMSGFAWLNMKELLDELKKGI